MSNFQKVKEVQEEFVYALENRLNSVDELPWKKVIQPEFKSADEAYTMVQDEIEGVLPMVSKEGAMKAFPLPESKFKEQNAVEIGGIVRFTEQDVNRESGNMTIPDTTIYLRKSRSETKASMLNRAMNQLLEKFHNTILKISGEWLTGSFTFSDYNGNDRTYTTNITDGGTVGTLWSDYANATPIADMEAIDTALQGLAGNRGRTIEFGNTIMSRKIYRHLLQVEQIQRLPLGDSLKRVGSLGELQSLPAFNEYFGEVIAHNKVYKDNGVYNHPATENHIQVFSATQNQPAGRLIIVPGEFSEYFTGGSQNGGRGISMQSNVVQPDSLNNYAVFEIAIKGILIPVSNFDGYTIQVI